jgi:excisionase family DNA binding protein
MAGPLLDKHEVARLLGVKPAYVLDLARRRKIHCVHLGKYVRFDADQLEADIAALTVAATPPQRAAPVNYGLHPLPRVRKRRFG